MELNDDVQDYMEQLLDSLSIDSSPRATQIRNLLLQIMDGQPRLPQTTTNSPSIDLSQHTMTVTTDELNQALRVFDDDRE